MAPMDRTLRIEELLNEAGWLRQLAASLVGDRAQAEDLVQDTWVAALRRPPHEGEPRPWLARVLRNRMRNAGRDRVRREAREELVREERLAPDAAALAQEAEAQRLLAEAVTRLDEPLRAVIVLRYFQGVDSNAAAARLGVPASTLRTRLQRALEALRADLDRREGGRASWAALLAPLARGASVGASSSALGAVAALVVTAGAACLLAAFAVTRGSSAADETIAALPAAPAENAPPTLSTLESADETVAVAAQNSREPVDAAEQPTSSDSRPEQAKPGATTAASEEEMGVLSGTIFIDGQPPEWPLELQLDLQLPRSSAPLPERLDASRRRLLLLDANRDLDIEPEARGEFTFTVPLRGSFFLSVTDFTFVDGRSTFDVAAPTTGLVLNLRSDPQIIGRLVDGAGAPIASLDGRSSIERGVEGRPETHEHRFRTRADGRFRIPSMPWPDTVVVTVLVESGTYGYLRFESAPFAAEAGTDLGDLRLEPVRSVPFTVRSSDGSPIERVFACIEPTSTSCKPMTCPGGAGALTAVPDREVTLRFGAYAHADRIVRAAPGAVLEVELERLTALEVRLLDPDADHVALSDEQPLFHWDDVGWSNTPWGEPGVCHRWRRTWTETPERRYEYQYWRGDGGRLEIAGLKPGVPITVEARDVEERPLASRTVSLSAGEHAVIELGTPGPAGAAPAREPLEQVLRKREAR